MRSAYAARQIEVGTYRQEQRPNRTPRRSGAGFPGRGALLGGLVLLLLVAVGVVAQRRPADGRTRYHCPMHPDYVATDPGDCPVCGMRLVPLTQAPAPVAGEGRERVAVEIRPETQRVLGLAVSEAAIAPLGKTIHAVGRVSLAPPSHLVAANAGTIREIYQNPGAAGALRLRATEPILSLADASDTVVLQAPGPLVLLSTPPAGFHVDKGQEVYQYIDLSTIFVLADVKSADIPQVRAGLLAKVNLPAHPGQTWQGSVTETSPQFDERLQTLRVKLQLPNEQPEIWPGMRADVELETPTQRMLAIPESAVIADGEGAVVFVAQGDDRFAPRKVETGLRAGPLVQIKGGLSAGERVVTSATFLLDAESRLQALAQTPDDRR